MPDHPDWWNGFGPAFHAAIQKAERRGRMTYRELDAVIPSGNCSSKEIETLLEYLRRREIELDEDEASN